MRALLALSACLALTFPSLGQASTYMVSPTNPDMLWYIWDECCSTDTICLLPGTYEVIGWPLELTSDSPALVGAGGPEGVILRGKGVEQAFLLDEFINDAHIHLERLTFSRLAEIIGRPDEGSYCGGALHFTDNIVEHCGLGPLYPGLKVTICWGIIARNTFRNNYGPAIVTYHTTAAIEDNEMYGNRCGITDWCCDGPPIRRNYVHDNALGGISTGYANVRVIEYNLIERNGGVGLELGYTGTVQHNVIRDNVVGVAATSWIGAATALHGNDIYDNSEANLKVYTESPSTWDCTMNWWGSTYPEVISRMIWDSNDDPEVGTCVIFEPFCTSLGCEPTPVESMSWAGIKALFRR